jgi:hypothetical protein
MFVERHRRRGAVAVPIAEPIEYRRHRGLVERVEEETDKGAFGRYEHQRIDAFGRNL